MKGPRRGFKSQGALSYFDEYANPTEIYRLFGSANSNVDEVISELIKEGNLEIENRFGRPVFYFIGNEERHADDLEFLFWRDVRERWSSVINDQHYAILTQLLGSNATNKKYLARVREILNNSDYYFRDMRFIRGLMTASANAGKTAFVLMITLNGSNSDQESFSHVRVLWLQVETGNRQMYMFEPHVKERANKTIPKEVSDLMEACGAKNSKLLVTYGNQEASKDCLIRCIRFLANKIDGLNLDSLEYIEKSWRTRKQN